MSWFDLVTKGEPLDLQHYITSNNQDINELSKV